MHNYVVHSILQKYVRKYYCVRNVFQKILKTILPTIVHKCMYHTNAVTLEMAIR